MNPGERPIIGRYAKPPRQFTPRRLTDAFGPQARLHVESEYNPERWMGALFAVGAIAVLLILAGVIRA